MLRQLRLSNNLHIKENTDFLRQKPQQLQSAEANFEGCISYRVTKLVSWINRINTSIPHLNMTKWNLILLELLGEQSLWKVKRSKLEKKLILGQACLKKHIKKKINLEISVSSFSRTWCILILFFLLLFFCFWFFLDWRKN